MIGKGIFPVRAWVALLVSDGEAAPADADCALDPEDAGLEVVKPEVDDNVVLVADVETGGRLMLNDGSSVDKVPIVLVATTPPA